MDFKNGVSRRSFVSGLAAALGYAGLGPDFDLLAQGRAAGQGRPAGAGAMRGPQSAAQYDAMAKLASNENNWGIPDSVMKSMEGAWKYAGRYGYPGALLTVLNYAHQPLPVQLRIAGTYSQVQYESPEEDATLLPHQHRDGYTEFVLPALRIGGRVFLTRVP